MCTDGGAPMAPRSEAEVLSDAIHEELDEDEAGDAGLDAAVMSIGALSRASGIPVATLRSWERRYGFPVAERRASGHRRYPVALVERLRLVQRALELGNRPSEVVHASLEALSALVGLRAPMGHVPAVSPAPDALLAAAAALDPRAFERGLRGAFDRDGARIFLYETLLPLMRRIGEAWAHGALSVVHEHFASERARTFLAERWRSHATGARPIVCAALPGEQHDLGLHAAALLLSLAGASPVFLGANTPLEDIAEAARQGGAVAVLVGSSPAADPALTWPLLEALRRLVPAELPLAVGGVPADAPAGVAPLATFDAFEAWLGALDAAPARA